jgi:phenylalanyl-tRNA synthetase beta chain
MNISYNWLNDLINIDLAPELLAEKLTRVGLAVEGIHPHGDDYVLDIDLTSNRPDCLSHLGVARELRVITGNELKSIDDNAQTEPPYPVVLAPNIVKIGDPDLCHRFTARFIKNVKIGPSPEWLVRRLEAIGERSINNVADITNYVMHELGQPMHSFDLDKLAESRIVVRRAKSGEKIKTLDEVERKLDESMLTICDAQKPVAVAGVMGGFDSGITESTVNVLLEVAYFNRESIRNTSRKLNLATEASYRFERGVDIQNLVNASNRATDLICELANGERGEFIDIYPIPFVPKEIESPDISGAVKQLTGLDVASDECTRILAALGINAGGESAIRNPQSAIYLAPSWRHDVAIEEDLVEEVARHAGYENIADELPPAFGAGEYQPSEMRKAHLRQSLTDIGFDEAISYSFIDTSFDEQFDLVPGIIENGEAEKFVTLQDSVIEGAVRMRPTLMPGLLDAVRTNFNHQRRDISLFEIGKVFAARGGEDHLPYERELFGLVVTGGEMMQDRAMPARQLDFYDAKGALESALDAAGISGIEFSTANVKHLRKGQSAAVSLNGKKVGYLGRLSDEITMSYKFRQPVFVAEVDLQTLLAANTLPIVYRPLPKYPSIVRDVSLLAKRSVSFSDIYDAIADQNIELLRRIEFVDVYEGKGVADDERSITIRLEYRNDERTLVEKEVDETHRQIVARLEAELAVKQRF